MNHQKSRFAVARALLIFWCLFIGIGALWGGTAMLIKPDGSLLQMQEVLKYFEKLPFSELLFRDYTFSGIALICVNGLTNIAAALLLFKRKKQGVICGMVFGITLMLWICIQFYLFPAEIIALSLAYFLFGLLQALTGYAAWVFYCQEQFKVDVSDYPNIGTNPKYLVVYFSRMGYTRKAAFEQANRLGAAVYEITSPEPTSGTGGFWWCGFFGMRGKDMPIDPLTVDLTQYEHVTLCTPIWVFRLCAPMQTFCKQAKGKLHSVSYVLLHHTNARYDSVVRHMDQLLELSHRHVCSIRCRLGKMKTM